MKNTHHGLPFVVCLLLLPGFVGCQESKKVEESREASSAAAAAQYRDEMLVYAIDNLNRLEEFNSVDTLQGLLERFDPRNRKPERRVDPLLAVWPEPEMFRQVIDRLNQWIHAQTSSADWKVDPMVASLPKPLLDLPQVKNLGQMEISAFDGFTLQEAAWLRDITVWAKGDGLEDIDRAGRLFDWTIRNIQIDVDRPNRIPQFPRETLLFGHGTASERAWVFILLLRQLDIDAALLAIDEGRGERGEGGAAKDSKNGDSELRSVGEQAKRSLRPWCVGVLIDGEIYLFDPLQGLPIPAPNGVSLDETGQLVIRPATLAQVAADDKLLRRMDQDESRTYGVKASDLKRVVAQLEASPFYLAKPMRVLESHLTGAQKMVLSTSPSAVAKHWEAAKLADVRLWQLPFVALSLRSRLDWRVMQAWLEDVLPLYMVYEERSAGRAKKTSMDPLEMQDTQEPRGPQVVRYAAPLYKGRVLSLKGKFTGDDAAIRCFQIARPSHQSLATSSADPIEKQVRLWAKQDATYWSGLVAYERGNYSAAVDYFMKRTLETYPNSPWTTGARYNLARSYESSGETRRAILTYGTNAESPGYDGDLLRAKWLEELGAKKKPEKN